MTCAVTPAALRPATGTRSREAAGSRPAPVSLEGAAMTICASCAASRADRPQTYRRLRDRRLHRHPPRAAQTPRWSATSPTRSSQIYEGEDDVLPSECRATMPAFRSCTLNNVVCSQRTRGATIADDTSPRRPMTVERQACDMRARRAFFSPRPSGVVTRTELRNKSRESCVALTTSAAVRIGC